MSETVNHLGVCSWSLRAASSGKLIDALREVGLSAVQLDLNSFERQPEAWAEFSTLARDAGITPVSGAFSPAGENYATLETIRETGGVVPDATWERNWGDLQACANLAATLAIPLVTLHAGFLPADIGDPTRQKLLGRIRLIADLFGRECIEIALETGQETAAVLRTFLLELDRKNVGVNFDPANMLLYGKGDPVEAVDLLAPWVRQVHLKDACRAIVPGAWGKEVPVGEGEVDWPAFFDRLARQNFSGMLMVEREAGENRVAEIRQAVRFIGTLLAKNPHPVRFTS